APPAQPAHRGIEPDGEERRDEDQHEDRGGVAHAQEDRVRHDDAEPAQQADHERVAPVDRRPGAAEPALALVLLDRILGGRLGLVLGLVVCGHRGISSRRSIRRRLSPGYSASAPTRLAGGTVTLADAVTLPAPAACWPAGSDAA